jgi:hypothetical protein
MSRGMRRSGISRVEVAVIIACIGVLLALLLPSIQTNHHHGRRWQCANNLRNIALSLQNYHDKYKMFPKGAAHSGLIPGGVPPVTAALGPSWWYAVLPFADTRRLPRIPDTQRTGGPPKHEFRWEDMEAAGISLSQFAPEYMRCPSSPIPMMETPTGPILLPTYVGIAGGCDIDPKSLDYEVSGGVSAGLVAPKTDTVWHNKFKGTGAAAGSIVTSSGMLPPCQHVRLAQCSDGTSNIVAVAEQSDWLLDRDQSSSGNYHGDAGWTVGGTGPGGGWLSGTRRVDPVPQVDTPGGPPAIWGADCWNLTTVRYRPNFKRVMGAPPLPGCSENHGINNPVQSPHPGGLIVGMADGSVQFVAQTTDLAVLLRMAIRDDGQTVNGEAQ